MNKLTECDVIQIKVPLPFPLRWVNSYLLRGRDGYTLIDPGLHTLEAEQLWEKVLIEHGIRYTDINQIVLTHHHPDHYGLAGWFRERTVAAPIWISQIGLDQVERLWGEGQPLTAEIYSLFVRHGMADEIALQMISHMNGFVAMVSPQPQVFSILQPGETFRLGDRTCEMILTPGHAAGHICFYDAQNQEMFCGDHVLPQISPNVSYTPGVDENPLHSFLISLEEISRYEVKRAYPGHREPFSAFQERAGELIVHHHQRLLAMLSQMNSPISTYELCVALFGNKLSLHQLRFAMSETLAHVIYLHHQGQIKEIPQDQIVKYETVEK